jgi:Na+-transporting NADH:ubiquinone oxidoreductase subunit NqrE
MDRSRTPQLYCPAGLAARARGRTLWLAVAALAAVLGAVALATPWGLRGALIAFVAAWALWMALMPVAVIASAVRS